MGWLGKKLSASSTTFAPAPVAGPPAAPAGQVSQERIVQLGTELLTLARRHKSGLLSSAFYSDALMNWSMKDPLFKVQMFRFVDCFPVLKDAEDIYDHLQDYLTQPGVTVPAPIAAALSAGKLAKGLAVGTIRKQIESMAGKFIAGTAPASALPTLRAL
ncbi:MAG: hypothetical protein ACK5RX_10220, partial [bacterium]